MSSDSDIEFLRMANAVAARSRDNGNHPFGSILTDASGKVILEAENSYQTDKGPGHAEANLAREAARKYDWSVLETCTLYTSVEPCCMCVGAAYWAGIGAIVYGMTEVRLGELTGDHPENLTMDLPARDVLAAGRREIEIRGPYPELEEELLETHKGFWD